MKTRGSSWFVFPRTSREVNYRLLLHNTEEMGGL